MCAMAAQAAGLVNLLLSHGRPDMLRIPRKAQGFEGVENKEELGWAYLWYEVGRVHEQVRCSVLERQCCGVGSGAGTSR